MSSSMSSITLRRPPFLRQTLKRADGSKQLELQVAAERLAEEPMAALIVHINREALHHGAEIALLRDLYQWKDKR